MQKGLKTVGTYTIPEVLDHIGEGDREYDGWIVHMDSQRYELFKAKGTQCVRCGLEGTVFLLQRQRRESPTNPSNRAHFNLYAEVEGKWVLLTKDHIIPRAEGGRDQLSNYQTMCAPCNFAKADTLPGTANPEPA